MAACNIATVNAEETSAEEANHELIYIKIEPIITTNYLKKANQKPGFIQLSAQLVVRKKLDADKVVKHMPIVRAFIIDFLSFTQESVIKDVKQRKKLRGSLTEGIQKILTEHTGEPLIDDLVIGQFMWD